MYTPNLFQHNKCTIINAEALFAKSPRNTRFRASDSDTIIQADRSACIARGADPPRTSATAAMGWLQYRLLGTGSLLGGNDDSIDLLGSSLRIWEEASAAAGGCGHPSTSPQCLLSPPSRSTRRRQQRCATWWRGSTPSGEPVGESGLLLSGLVCGSRKRAFSGAATPPSGVHLLAAAGPWCWDAGDASSLTTG
jgi:hypothetical protein